ncbi:MAG: 3-deoxy-7-phosphoheptulonate synthase [Lachnospiraceae bacterium]|nr:3-deoxy-7-phosphoheptulonate synthase [Lachnospiraceae bacterium]MEE3377184.1 3-deoxy-7-phosphoheptulonate synthase [Lachnospiraceae bacterium]
MIVILKNKPDPDQLEGLISWLNAQDIDVHPTVGSSQTILGLVGDTSRIDMNLIAALDIVEAVKRVAEPYKNANRKFHPDDTVIRVGDAVIGGGSLTVIAGPCAVESEDQLMTVARAVKEAGANLLRASAFKPRSSPYAFQGLGIEGIRLLMKEKEEVGLPVVSEIYDSSQLPLFADIDVLMVGAKNMQNYALLRALGKTEKPVILKRGFSNTYEEWLMSAEYILAGGNKNVILCERGIRTFEPSVSGTLDVTSVPVLKGLTHLPVIIDPSSAGGKYTYVPALARAGVAAGADGVMIEVHNDPTRAKCDGPQSLTPKKFAKTAESLRRIHSIIHEEEM